MNRDKTVSHLLTRPSRKYLMIFGIRISIVNTLQAVHCEILHRFKMPKFTSDAMCDQSHGCNNRQYWLIAGKFMGEADPRRLYAITVHRSYS